MRLGRIFNDQMGKIKTHLTQLDGQALGKAALVILLFLDLFILVAIFDGLDEHTRQLSSPDEYIPSSCRKIVIDQQWNPTTRIGNLAPIITSFSGSYYRIEEQRRDRHPVCEPYLDLFDQIKDDKGLTSTFETRKKIKVEARELQRAIKRQKGAYDSSLLESIAQQQQQEGEPAVAALKADFHRLTAQLAALEQTINGDEKVKRLWALLQGLQEPVRQELLTDLRRLNFWYPVKKLAMQLLFLLPLFAVFYAWNSLSIRKRRGVQALVSTHLLVVAFIPIFGKIIETIYDIIPHKILQRIISLLESFKLVALWHYLVITLAIAAALALIYLCQKKLFTRARLMERRIAKGECQQCGKHLPAEALACPFCGFSQFKSCTHCPKLMHVHAKYCRECGTRAGP